MSGEGGRLRAVVVGCHGIGKAHAAGLLKSRRVELAGVCDINAEEANALAAASGGVAVYGDFGAMLRAAQPDIVALGVPTFLHAPLAVQAMQAGVRGIFGEKPMAANLGEARGMIDAATAAGAVLIVNHQRRTRRDLIEMRRLAESGAVGQVEVVRASSAGDVITDGTHAIDSLRFLAGDKPVQWLLGQVHHAPIVEGQPLGKAVVNKGGQRYRHNVPIESGAMACWQFEGGPRAELFMGDCRLPTPYQHYEIRGTEGRLVRPGDRGEHTLYLQSPATGGRLEPVQVTAEADDVLFAANYDRLAAALADGTPHPLAAEHGYAALEVIMGTYESARLARRIEFPVAQMANPMELMVAAGRLATG